MEEKDPANDELIQEASEKKKNQIKKKKKRMNPGPGPDYPGKRNSRWRAYQCKGPEVHAISRREEKKEKQTGGGRGQAMQALWAVSKALRRVDDMSEHCFSLHTHIHTHTHPWDASNTAPYLDTLPSQILSIPQSPNKSAANSLGNHHSPHICNGLLTPHHAPTVLLVSTLHHLALFIPHP